MAQCLHPKLIRNPLYGAKYHRTKGVEDLSRPVLPGENTEDKQIVVPCNKCLNCRTNRQNDWAWRMEIEYLDTLKKGGCAYFITYTYDDKHIINVVNPDESEEPTLYVPDVQRFHKRLRKAGINFRNFTIGEYGGTFSRPHYHGMYFFSGEVKPSEVHDEFFDKWRKCEPERLSVDPFSIADAKYIAKYSLKAPHVDFGYLQKPFAVCSRKPAIGSCFLTSSGADKVVRNQSYLVTDCGGTPYNLPRYFKQKLFTPLERKNILDEYQTKELLYDAALVGYDNLPALRECRNISAWLDERYRVNKLYLEEFGKDCRVSYDDYMVNIEK